MVRMQKTGSPKQCKQIVITESLSCQLRLSVLQVCFSSLAGIMVRMQKTGSPKQCKQIVITESLYCQLRLSGWWLPGCTIPAAQLSHWPVARGPAADSELSRSINLTQWTHWTECSLNFVSADQEFRNYDGCLAAPFQQTEDKSIQDIKVLFKRVDDFITYFMLWFAR